MKKLAALLITVFAFSAFGFTFFPDGDNGTDDFGPKGKFIEELKLTGEQQAKFDDLHYNHQKMAIDTRAEIQKNRLELKKMLMDNNINESSILKLTEANNNLHAKLKTSRTQMWLNIYKILNKDQQEMWTKHLAHMGERLGGKFGRGMHDGHGKGCGFRNFDNDDRMTPRDGRGKF